MNAEYIRRFATREGSYSILIQLYSTVGQKNFLQFKPIITFQSTYENDIIGLKKMLNITTKISTVERKNVQTVYKIRIQGAQECAQHVNNVFLKDASIITKIKSTLLKRLDYIIQDDNTKKAIKLFYESLILIEKYGATHSTWKDELVEIIDLKLEINKIGRTRPGFTKEEWIQKIKKHLEANK